MAFAFGELGKESREVAVSSMAWKISVQLQISQGSKDREDDWPLVVLKLKSIP